MSSRTLHLTLGVVTGLLAAALYLGVRGPEAASVASAPDPFLRQPFTAPPLVLEDPDGQVVRLRDFGGQVVALFFGYTQCPDVCPITLAQLARIQSEIDPTHESLRIVFVSLDPARDTPDALERFGQSFGSGITMLTAPVERLRPQVLDYGIGFVYRPRAGGPVDSVAPNAGNRLGDDYLVDHTARTFLIDRSGRVVATVLPESTAETLRDAIERVMDTPDDGDRVRDR